MITIIDSQGSYRKYGDSKKDDNSDVSASDDKNQTDVPLN
jgi:hypothetical protein